MIHTSLHATLQNANAKKIPNSRRNTFDSVYHQWNRGWYTYLTPKEQQILKDPLIEIASAEIPEDENLGFCRLDLRKHSFSLIPRKEIVNIKCSGMDQWTVSHSNKNITSILD